MADPRVVDILQHAYTHSFIFNRSEYFTEARFSLMSMALSRA